MAPFCYVFLDWNNKSFLAAGFERRKAWVMHHWNNNAKFKLLPNSKPIGFMTPRKTWSTTGALDATAKCQKHDALSPKAFVHRSTGKVLRIFWSNVKGFSLCSVTCFSLRQLLLWCAICVHSLHGLHERYYVGNSGMHFLIPLQCKISWLHIFRAAKYLKLLSREANRKEI